jgi:hypothetical protein
MLPVGEDVYDRLREMGYGGIVEAVNFGAKPRELQPLDENGRPMGGRANRRAEMWMKSKEWLEQEAVARCPIRIP